MDIFRKQNLIEFAEHFNSDDACTKYLSNLKWSDGFKCVKCGNERCQVRKNNSRTCNKCSHTESPTANTIFHRVRFGIRKAFCISYEMFCTTKKLSTTNVGIRYGLNEKTARLFMNKVSGIINEKQTISTVKNTDCTSCNEDLLNEVGIIEQEFKILVAKKTLDNILENDRCFSKNIYSENQTLSLQLYSPQGYLYCFLVIGNAKDRLILSEFPHNKILFEKRYAFDRNKKNWCEFSNQLENLNQCYSSKIIANKLYSTIE